MVGGNAGTPNHSAQTIYPFLRIFSLGYMKGIQIVHQALSLLVLNFLCKPVDPVQSGCHFRSVPFPLLPSMSEKREGMCFWKVIQGVFQGCRACSAALRCPWAISSHSASSPPPPTPPPQGPSQHSWALSEMAVKCTVKRRDGQAPLNGKKEAHQLDSVVQFAGLFISDHQRVCLLYGRWVSNRDKPGPRLLKMAGGQRWISREFSSLGHVPALLLSNLKLPFHPSTRFPVPSLFSLHRENGTLILTLLKIRNLCICLLGSGCFFFLKTSINSFWWCNFHNAIL